MTRPSFRYADPGPCLGEDGNAGLWFDKFCDRWRVQGTEWTMSAGSSGASPKLEWISSLTKKNPFGAPAQLEEYASRLMRLIMARGGQADVFVATSRFVTGLGRSHPIENGFSWHPTLGVPYLPGSSVKGLTRAWALEHGEEAAATGIFGDPGTASRVGFLDALPAAPVCLEADVMTPHYAGWTRDDPPGDWCSPMPIPFLVAAAGTSLLFGIVPMRHVAGVDPDLQVVSGWTRSALEWLGGGAKTAVGYGRFWHDERHTDALLRLVTEQQREVEEQRRRQGAMATPEGRWRLRIEGRSEEEVLDLVRIHLGVAPLTDQVELDAFVEAVRSTGLVEYWRRGQVRDPRTNIGQKKLRQRARLLDQATER